MSKLEDLAKIDGRTEEELLQEATFEGVAKGICTNPNCNYTCDVEPDQDKGYCELCDTNTVSSCLVLADII
jgi:hypothetical protein